VSLPVILRHEAEVDVQEARDQLEAVRAGLGTQVLARVREVLARAARRCRSCMARFGKMCVP